MSERSSDNYYPIADQPTHHLEAIANTPTHPLSSEPTHESRPRNVERRLDPMLASRIATEERREAAIARAEIEREILREQMLADYARHMRNPIQTIFNLIFRHNT